MTLKNLLKIGQLKEHPVSAQEIERLLAAAQRNLRDAHVKGISAETRFDAAYKATMQCALAALMMHGYRPDTNRPGHHMTVLQSTPGKWTPRQPRVSSFLDARYATNTRAFRNNRIHPLHSPTPSGRHEFCR